MTGSKKKNLKMWILEQLSVQSWEIRLYMREEMQNWESEIKREDGELRMIVRMWAIYRESPTISSTNKVKTVYEIELWSCGEYQSSIGNESSP